MMDSPGSGAPESVGTCAEPRRLSVEMEGVSYALHEGESVLDALLRQGRAVPYSCKSGVCGSCMMRAERDVPVRAQEGLKDVWKARGYFLACVCYPERSLSVAMPGDDARVPARIVGLDRLNGQVLRVRLVSEHEFHYHAGQYLTLLLNGGLARTYSIASLPDEGYLELHVRRLPQGRMSTWLHDSAQVGDVVSVQGPSGECFYVAGREQQPLLLVGTGTGLAPLYGIVRDALRHGHRGEIHLLHGAVRHSGLYLTGELKKLAGQHPQLHYTTSVLEAEGAEGLPAGPIEQIVSERFRNVAGWRGYVCGDPALVQALKKRLFLAGMASRDIHADAFLPAADG